MQDVIWMEKYRPYTLDDICGQDEIVKRLKVYVKNRNFPSLMFTGFQGTGKTSSAIAMANEIYGDMWSGNFKEINASDQRGIDVVRSEIKEYANTKPIGQLPFKILFLDEVDNTTNDAQSALRRTMERYSRNCKFILSCNYSSKIIEPIQSRCALFRFKRISPKDTKNRILYIAEKEGLKISNDAIDAITYISEGDLRKAVNSLETASLMDKEISIESIYKASGMSNPENIREMIEWALKGSFVSSINRLDILMFEEGFNGLDIVSQMFKQVMIMNIPDKMKVEIIDSIGETDFRISEGANDIIQMKWLIAKIMKIGK